MSRIDYSHTTHLTDTFFYAYNIPDGLLLRSMRAMKKIIWIIEIGHLWYIRKMCHFIDWSVYNSNTDARDHCGRVYGGLHNKIALYSP